MSFPIPLHFYDIANIPLTMAHKESYIKQIKQEMNIPQNEKPILLIGIGSYKNSWKVAQSKRKERKDYTKWNL